MKLKTLVISAIALLIVVAATRMLASRKDDPDSSTRAVANATPRAGAVALSPLDLSAADVLEVKPIELTGTVELSGSLKAANSAFVKARVAGELKSLKVREGDAVKAGQVIGQIDATEFDLRLRQAQQQAESGRAQVEIAERALRNNRALVDQGFISPTALDTSVSNAAAARATLNASLAAVDLARKARNDASLVAPLAGLVSQRLAQPGERVAVEARIVEIVDLSRMEMEAAVPPQDATQLRVGQRAKIVVEGMGAPVNAVVARISPSAQAGSRAVLVYLAVDPAPGLRQGLFARGRVAVNRRTALAVPETVVRNDRSLPSVPVLKDGKVLVRTVTLGARGAHASAGGDTDVAHVEVLEGLAPGDRVLAGVVGVVRDGTPARVPGSPANVATPAQTPGASAPR